MRKMRHLQQSLLGAHCCHTRAMLPHALTCDATEAAWAAPPASARGGGGSASVTSVEPLLPAASW